MADPVRRAEERPMNHEELEQDAERWRFIARHAQAYYGEDSDVQLVVYLRDATDTEIDSNEAGPTESVTVQVDDARNNERLEEITKLMESPEGELTPEQATRLDHLVIVTQAYESKRWPLSPPEAPHA